VFQTASGRISEKADSRKPRIKAYRRRHQNPATSINYHRFSIIANEILNFFCFFSVLRELKFRRNRLPDREKVTRIPENLSRPVRQIVPRVNNFRHETAFGTMDAPCPGEIR